VPVASIGPSMHATAGRIRFRSLIRICWLNGIRRRMDASVPSTSPPDPSGSCGGSAHARLLIPGRRPCIAARSLAARARCVAPSDARSANWNARNSRSPARLDFSVCGLALQQTPSSPGRHRTRNAYWAHQAGHNSRVHCRNHLSRCIQQCSILLSVGRHENSE